MNPGNVFSELKRRNVYKVAVAYAVVGWLIAQVATQIFPFLEIPNWVIRLVGYNPGPVTSTSLVNNFCCVPLAKPIILPAGSYVVGAFYPAPLDSVYDEFSLVSGSRNHCLGHHSHRRSLCGRVGARISLGC